MGFSDIMDLLHPGRTKAFFRRMHPKTLGANLRYLAVLGIPTFVGSFLLHGVFGVNMTLGMGTAYASATVKFTISDSLILALMDYIRMVVLPVLVGVAFAIFAHLFMGRRVPLNEGITLFSYGYTPALLLSVFIAFSLTGILVLVAGGLYSIYLIYRAGQVTFAERWAKVWMVLFFMIAGASISLALGFALDTVAHQFTGSPADVSVSAGSGTESIGFHITPENFEYT